MNTVTNKRKFAPPKTNQRRDELNYFNAIACLLVILIHVLSVGIVSLDSKSLQLAAIYIPWNFAAYVVPGFLFVGAVKMALGFNSSENTGYTKYIWKRIVKIYFPYIITSCVYFAYYYFVGWYVADPMFFLRLLFTGLIASPFYYIVTVMQFYLLMPLWKFTLKKIPWFTAIPISVLITFVSLRLSAFLGVFGITDVLSDRIFTTYLIFWVLGLYVGANYSKIYSAVLKHKKALLICAVPSILFTLLNYWQHSTGNIVFTSDISCMKVISDIMSIMLFMTICIIIKNAKLPKLKKVLDFIFGASFSVFLSHCLFLYLADMYIIQKFGITDIGLQLIIRFVICYTLPFLWYWLLKKVKYPVKKFFRKKKTS